jgi:hypothetical protein
MGFLGVALTGLAGIGASILTGRHNVEIQELQRQQAVELQRLQQEQAVKLEVTRQEFALELEKVKREQAVKADAQFPAASYAATSLASKVPASRIEAPKKATQLPPPGPIRGCDMSSVSAKATVVSSPTAMHDLATAEDAALGMCKKSAPELESTTLPAIGNYHGWQLRHSLATIQCTCLVTRPMK